MRVRDTGAGIPPEQLPRIFEKFYQADNQRAARAAGTGLGLAIAKGIVEAHGGWISCESTVGVGTTFTIRLPVRATRRSRGAARDAGHAGRRRLVTQLTRRLGDVRRGVRARARLRSHGAGGRARARSRVARRSFARPTLGRARRIRRRGQRARRLRDTVPHERRGARGIVLARPVRARPVESRRIGFRRDGRCWIPTSPTLGRASMSSRRRRCAASPASSMR